jgi:RHS repeat-associated protein
MRRLDATGLYYYNARYYDATIGRFISPDTIVPYPADPQSFNRYSYCRNNPLKYTDPSGNVVTIGGVDVRDIEAALKSGDYSKIMSLGSQIMGDPNTAAGNNQLLSAYGWMKSVAPRLASYVENCDPVVNLVEGNINDAGLYTGKTDGGNLYIASWAGDYFSDKGIAAILGHELFHAAIRIGTQCRDDFAANEIFAFSMGFEIANNLGCLTELEPLFGLHLWAGMNPSLDPSVLNAMLPGYSQTLYDSYGYHEGAWFWAKPLRVWSNHDTNGILFLTVAQQVWED